MNCDHSHGHDRTANATLVFLALFIAAVVAIIETHRDEIEAERDTIQAKIEQLQAYRHELDTAIQQRGIRPNDERIVHPTANPGIVKRSRQEKIDYVQSVPVVERRFMVAQAIREACSDGQKRTANEIFSLVLQRRPKTSRPSFDATFYTIGMSSCKDPSVSHHSAKVYWLPNTVGEARHETAN